MPPSIIQIPLFDKSNSKCRAAALPHCRAFLYFVELI